MSDAPVNEFSKCISDFLERRAKNVLCSIKKDRMYFVRTTYVLCMLLYVTYIAETFLERLVCEDEYDEIFKNIIGMRIVLNAYLFCMLRTFKRCFWYVYVMGKNQKYHKVCGVLSFSLLSDTCVNKFFIRRYHRFS